MKYSVDKFSKTKQEKEDCAMKRKNVFIVGESGVGKSTLMRGLYKRFSYYHMPIIFTTRNRRHDDDRSEIKHITEMKYNEMRPYFAISMEGGATKYGYLGRDLSSGVNGIFLLYGSPYALSDMKSLGLVILIEGDSIAGLQKRWKEDASKIRERQEINRALAEAFYGQKWFRPQMSIIFRNQFANINSTVERLNERIINLIEV